MYRLLASINALILLSLLSGSIAFAQTTTIIPGTCQIETSHALDSVAQKQLIDKELLALRKNGYWLAALDSVHSIGDRTIYYFYKGHPFDILDVQLTSNLSPTEQRLLLDLAKAYTPENMQAEIDQTIVELQSNGYPFAMIKSDSVTIKDGVLLASLTVDKAREIVFDSLTVSSDWISQRFLSNYLKIHEGSHYDQSLIEDIGPRLSKFEFINFKGLITNFGLGKAQVGLDLEQRRVNQFDGILGVVSKEGEGGVELTGALTLKVRNLFRSAKSIDIHWERLRPQSQELHLRYVHPILLGSPLDLSFSFDQIKQDSIFSNRALSLGLTHDFSSSIQLGLAYQNHLGNSLDELVEEYGDFEIDATQLSLKLSFLDDRLNPTKGWSSDLDLKVGAKHSLKTNQKSTQYSITTAHAFLQPVAKSFVAALGLNMGMLINDQLYINDLFRLGGLKTLRGFDEKEFFGSSYALMNIEWRYLLLDQSSIFVFYDHALLATDTFVSQSNSEAIGLGIGMHMATENGVLKLIYAMGKRSGGQFSFEQSKIHFGYVALF